jgi:hypothetical protein
MMVGVIKNQELLANLNLSIGSLSTGYAVYAYNGQKYNNGSSSTYMAAPSQNTVVTVAFDADTGSLYVGAGGSWANGSGSTNQTWANAVSIQQVVLILEIVMSTSVNVPLPTQHPLALKHCVQLICLRRPSVLLALHRRMITLMLLHGQTTQPGIKQ